MDMWVPDDGEALYQEYLEKADGFRRDAQDVHARYAKGAFGSLHLALLAGAVVLSCMFPEVGAFPSFALPFTSAALTFASFFSLNMIRALSDKEREYEQAAFQYSLKLTETIYSESLSDNYKRIVGARIRQMFRRMEDISRPVIMTQLWTKYHTTVSLLDLGAALFIFVLAHGAPGHFQAGLFWLSFLLSLSGLGITVFFTAKLAFQYY